MNIRIEGKGNTRLELLIERQKQLDVLLTAEKLRLAKRKREDDKKLIILIGQAACEAAQKSPEFHLALNEQLDATVTDKSKRVFLAERGYL